MKIYAHQVPPEDQESPIFLEGCFPDNIAVCGNRDFAEHTTEEFDIVKTVLEEGELADTLENVNELQQWYKDATEAISDYLPSSKGKYSTNSIHALKNLIIAYHSCQRSPEKENLCKVLSIVTGKKWAYGTIRGYCQSDWQYIFYPVDEWNKEALTRFETEYFNTGTEWVIHDDDEETEPESPEDVIGFTMYCTSWNDEGIKQEIAEATGCKIEDIVLYEFDGYTRTAKYKEA